MEYLSQKSLAIEILDSESLFVLGITKLPLNELILRDSFTLSKVVEIDVCEIEFGRVVGSL